MPNRLDQVDPPREKINQEEGIKRQEKGNIRLQTWLFDLEGGGGGELNMSGPFSKDCSFEIAQTVGELLKRPTLQKEPQGWREKMNC